MHILRLIGQSFIGHFRANNGVRIVGFLRFVEFDRLGLDKICTVRWESLLIFC